MNKILSNDSADRLSASKQTSPSTASSSTHDGGGIGGAGGGGGGGGGDGANATIISDKQVCMNGFNWNIN